MVVSISNSRKKYHFLLGETHLCVCVCVSHILCVCICWDFVYVYVWDFFLNRIMVDFQCFVNLCCIAKQFKYTHTHTHTHTFKFLSVMAYHRILNIVLCAIQQDLLFIHSVYSSLHLLTPASHSIPSLILSFLETRSLFSVSVNLFLFHRQVHFQIAHISAIIWHLSLSL